MRIIIPWQLYLIVVVAIIASCQPRAMADELPPMIAASWIEPTATVALEPTPIVDFPVIFTEFVWIPIVVGE